MGINASFPRFLSGKRKRKSRLSYFREKQKLRKVDHDATDEVNLLMDKWRPSDVLILMRKFKEQARLQHVAREKEQSKRTKVRKRKLILEHSDDEYESDNDSTDLREDSVVPLTLDLHGFCQIFSELDHMPQEMAKAAFELFCNDEEQMDFREFCTAITICCHGSEEKKASIIFNLFDSNKDGFLSPQDIEELARTAIISMERLETDERPSNRTLWMKEAGQDLLNDLSKSKQKISLQDFLFWAEKNKIITYLLEVFRIVPTSEIEARTVRNILRKHRKMKVNEVWYVLSSKWWETWCMYASFRAFDEVEHANANISASSNGSPSASNIDAKISKEIDDSINLSTDIKDIQMSDTKVVSPYFSAVSSETEVDEITSSMESVSLPTTRSRSALAKSAPDSSSPSSRSDFGGKSLVRSRSLSHTSGDRPGPFDNYHLEGDVKETLKLNLLEGHDYILVPAVLWKHLKNWYGGGPDYARNVVARKGSQSPKNRRTPYYIPPERHGVVLEMHPLVLIFASMDPRTGRPSKSAKEVRRIFSLVSTIEDMKNKVCKYFNMSAVNSRLWLKPKGGGWQQLSPKNSGEVQESLADADIETGDFIMIETKTTDVDPWPRDLIDKQNENFRDFEINSRVDAKDNNGKWYSGTVVDIKCDQLHEGVIIGVKISFDQFNSKWDEWYDVNSPKLKPLYTITEPRSDNVDINVSDRINHVSGNAVEEGAVGLINLGNTCYMNSVIQCLSNTPMFCDYFRTGLFEKELNFKNKRGSGCEVAFEFAQTLSKLWADQNLAPVKAISAKRLKRTFSKTPSLTPFAEYGQQDAHEFFSVLLDVLHEDINRVTVMKKIGAENQHSIKHGQNDLGQTVDSDVNTRKRLTSFASSSEKANSRLQKDKTIIRPVDSTTDSREVVETTVRDEAPDKELKVFSKKTENTKKIFGSPDAIKNDKVSNIGEGSNGESMIADKKWKEHLDENRSTIVDLFHGQLRRTLKCKACGHKTLKFEVFNCLSMALNAQFAYNVVLVPLPKKEKTASKNARIEGEKSTSLATVRTAYGVFTPQVGLVGDLKFALASVCKIPADRLIIATVENNTTVTIRPDRQRLHTIREDDNIYAFERPLVFNEICGHPVVAENNIPLKTNGSPSVNGDNNVVVGNKSSICGCFPFEPEHIGDDQEADSSRSIADNGNQSRNSTTAHWNFCRLLCGGGVSIVADNTEEEVESDAQSNRVEKSHQETEVPQQEKNGSNVNEGEKVDLSITESLMHERIDCLDKDNQWFAATVVAVDEGREEIKVRFDGYKSDFDEWINYNDEHRVMPLYSVVRKPRLELVVATLINRTVIRNNQSEANVGDDSGLNMVMAELDSLSASRGIDSKTSMNERYFGTPSLLYFSSHVSNADLLKIVEEHISSCLSKSKLVFDRRPYTVHINDLSKKKNWRKVEDHPGLALVRSGESIVIEWDSIDCYNDDVERCVNHETVQKVKGARNQEQENGGKTISLEDCFGEFTKPERLGDGYKCDNCKKADTTISKLDVWRLPDILVIHVKRFIYTMFVRGKLNNPMQYPLKNLDMSTILGKREVDGHDREMYDLYGVVHHMGSMGGGHYVATCKNPFKGNTESKDAWFEYNDSRVGRIEPEDVVRASGYLLFYHRKHLSPHNIINLKPI